MPTAALTRTAAAKVNLTLEITGRRDDGYHTLQSLVVFTEIADTLRFTFTRNGTLSVAVSGPEAGTLTGDDSNLALRAARMVQDRTGDQSGVSIALEKHIPLQAGLGGGSADAAAAVAACWATWAGSDMPPISDTDLAYELGADVPVCRHGRAAMMRGIGEVIHPIGRFPSAWLVLVNPRINVPTRDVFKTFEAPFSQQDTGPGGLNSFQALCEYVGSHHNDLTDAAVRIAPPIDDVLTALQSTEKCAAARMSGSGPTCFGLYESSESARQAAETLATTHPAWLVRPTPIIT